jgi:hypothetical protein
MAQGQGKPLPPFTKCKGEWIIENAAYIYHADNSSTAPTATFTPGIQRQDGKYAPGFDSNQLAAAFGIDRAALMEANKNQTLIFVGDRDGIPLHGGIRAVDYIFRIGSQEAILTTETYQQEGSA